LTLKYGTPGIQFGIFSISNVQDWWHSGILLWQTNESGDDGHIIIIIIIIKYMYTVHHSMYLKIAWSDVEVKMDIHVLHMYNVR
jgi:hypothetical protein